MSGEGMVFMKKKITKKDIDRLLQELEKTRHQLNELGASMGEVNDDLLQLSQKLDGLIVRYTKMVQAYKNNNKKPSA